MRVVYGIEVDEEPERGYLEIAEEMMERFSFVFTPGKYLVETFPALRFLPSWMPGAEFKRDCAELKQASDKLLNVPWDATMEAIVRPILSVTMKGRAHNWPVGIAQWHWAPFPGGRFSRTRAHNGCCQCGRRGERY